MAAPASDPHVLAVIALLTAALPAGVTVFDGEPTGTIGQTYVCVYSDPGSASASSLDNTPDQLAVLVQVTCVGTTAKQARAVKDAVAAALVGVRPVVSGRTCYRITEEFGAPLMQRDEATRDPEVDRPRFFYTPQYRMSSTV